MESTNEIQEGNQRFKLRTARDQIIDQIFSPNSLTFPLTDPPVNAKKPVVMFNEMGEVVVTSNQSDVNYRLIDETNTEVGTKQILTDTDLTIQSINLTREDYTLSVLAKKNISDLQKQLLQNVTIKVGVDENIPVSLKNQFIDFNTKNTVLLLQTQSNATYQVFEASDKENLYPLSALIDSGAGGDLAIETINIKEDTTIKVHVKNKKTNLSGTLKAKPRILVYPNDVLVPVLSSATAHDFAGSCTIEIPNTQASTNYQIIFKDIDDDKADKAKLATIPLSAAVKGNDASTSIKIVTKNLTEDLIVRILATKIDNGLSKELNTTLTVRVKPDHTKKLTQVTSPVKVGGNTDIRVESPQRGIEYQLRNNETGKEVGWRVYYHKDYGIERARIGFEFAIGEYGAAPVLLNTGALTATTTFNVMATKANTMEKAQLMDVITIVVA